MPPQTGAGQGGGRQPAQEPGGLTRIAESVPVLRPKRLPGRHVQEAFRGGQGRGRRQHGGAACQAVRAVPAGLGAVLAEVGDEGIGEAAVQRHQRHHLPQPGDFGLLAAQKA